MRALVKIGGFFLVLFSVPVGFIMYFVGAGLTLGFKTGEAMMAPNKEKSS